MKKINLYSVCIGIALVMFLVLLGMIFTGNIDRAGPYILILFIALALGFSGYESLNGFVFTTLIFAGVSAALYYPEPFTYVGDLKLTVLIIPLIQIIMFGMGTQMGLKDFAAVFKTPKGVLIGVAAQLLIMPFVGFVLAKNQQFSA